MYLSLPLLALWLASFYSHILAATPGSFTQAGQTLVSAMMVRIYYKLNNFFFFLTHI
jgi:hypothetical protein